MPSYRIADEPAPGRLAGLVVNPFWPLVASMVAGFWLALPWFALNGAALGSATRRRELAWIVGGALVSAALGGALLWAIGAGAIGAHAFRYALVGLVAWRIAVAYSVYALQQPSFELHLHFGGAARSGALLTLAAALVPLSQLVGKRGAAVVALLVG